LDSPGTKAASQSTQPLPSDFSQYGQYKDKDSAYFSDILVGTGAQAKEGSTITVKYTGWLLDGTVFDSTEKHGGTPATFQLAKGQLIDGWVQGIPGMKVGGKRRLVVPPAVGYGAQATGSIPANSLLVFDVELLRAE
jgi:FKBP-type peptidyl-prolyl cis-trans isomerase